MPTTERSNTEKDTNSGEFGNGSKSFPIIKAFNLTVAFSNETGFVVLNTAIRFKLHLINPFAPNGTFMRGQGHQSPSTIALGSGKLLLHGGTPLRVLDSLQKTCGFFGNGEVGKEKFVRGRETVIG
ncbi:hypothetical protein COP2_007553 [Malus domestica]